MQVRSTVPVVSAHFRSLLRHHARMFTCCKQAFTVVADHWNLIRQPSHVTVHGVQRRKLMGVTSGGWLTGVAGGDWSERADDRPMGGAPVAVTRPRRCHNGWKRTTTIDQLCVAQSRFAAWRGLTSVLSAHHVDNNYTVAVVVVVAAAAGSWRHHVRNETSSSQRQIVRNLYSLCLFWQPFQQQVGEKL